MNKRKTNQKLRRRADLDKGLLNKGWHSKSYHRHFEGYTEVEAINAKGKAVIQRIYTGDYYRLDLPAKKRVLLRVLYGISWLCACILFGLASSRPISANSTWYLAIVQTLSLFGLAAVLFSLIAHCTAPRDMTIGDWKGSSRATKRRSVFTAVFLAADAVLTLLHLLITGNDQSVHLLCVLFYLLAGGLNILINRLEASLPYRTFPSSQPIPEDGTYIDV